MRLVSTLHADGEGWDEVLDSMYKGWEAFLLNLRAYLTYFPGRRCSTVMEPRGRRVAGVRWRRSASPTRDSATASSRPADAAGTVEYRGERELLLRLERSASPASRWSTPTTGGTRPRPSLHLYLFGSSSAS